MHFINIYFYLYYYFIILNYGSKVFFLVTSKSHGLIHLRNVVNVINICNLKSITKKVYIKLIYMVNIISMIKGRKYISCDDYSNGYELLYVYVTEGVGGIQMYKVRRRHEFQDTDDQILLVLCDHFSWNLD